MPSNNLIRTGITVSIISFILISCMVLGGLFFLIQVPWVDLNRLEYSPAGEPSIVLDDSGHEIMRFQLDRRNPIIFTDLPPHIIQAFLAAEDHSFFEHAGISLKGIVRSLIVNFSRGKKLQGASTITQQLVRLLYFSQQKTLVRKIKEQIIALAVERHFTKELIFEAYVNNIYFGCGIYGIQAASQRFWQTDVQNISIAEAATLAAIIRNPSFYCPLIHPEATLKRRNLILKLMYSRNYISKKDYDEACASSLHLQQQEFNQIAPHARELIRQFMEQFVGKFGLYTQGYIIQSTLNSILQIQAEKSFKHHVTKLKKTLTKDVDGGLVTLDVQGGDIKALIGGYDFNSSQFNRATQALRQLGSVFKPIIYATALEEGMEFYQTFMDEPITLTDHNEIWTPQNYNHQFEGEMTLARALSISNNMVTIKLLLRLGIPKIQEMARAFHITHNLVPYPSLALGVPESTTLHAAAMFNTFANKGIYATPFIIEWIKDRHGKKIWKHVPHSERLISWKTSSKMISVLRQSFQRYTRRHPEVKKSDIISKTGTTNDSRTCWFATASPQHTTVIYIGRDNNQPLGNNVFGTTTAFPIWLDYYNHVLVCNDTFTIEPSLISRFIDPHTGTKTNPGSHAIEILVSSENS